MIKNQDTSSLPDERTYDVLIEDRPTYDQPGVKRMMLVKCAKCNKLFDSSFTVDDFLSLSEQQLESGTLHICVYCGHLGLYRVKDYVEADSTGVRSS